MRLMLPALTAHCMRNPSALYVSQKDCVGQSVTIDTPTAPMEFTWVNPETDLGDYAWSGSTREGEWLVNVLR